jgi:hypothetical protein
MNELQDVNIADGYSVCSALGAVAVLLWRDVPCNDGVRALQDVFYGMKNRRPAEKFGLLVIAEPRAGYNVPKGTRDLLGKLHGRYSALIGGTVVVFEGSDFRVVVGRGIARAVAAGINLLNRTSAVVTVEPNVTRGAQAICDALAKCDRHVTAKALETAVETLRRGSDEVASAGALK